VIKIPEELIDKLKELLKKIDVSCEGHCKDCKLNKAMPLGTTAIDYSICDILGEVLNTLSGEG
jgi:hypothetical protein